MNEYYNLKQKQQKEVNEFPMFFAFSNNQFVEGMVKLGLDPSDTDKIYSIGAGGYIRKSDSKRLSNLFDKNEAEMQKAIDEDITGLGFVYDMFLYELNNHEYGYTLDVEDTLNALDLSYDDIINNPKLSVGLNKAIEEIKKSEVV